MRVQGQGQAPPGGHVFRRSQAFGQRLPTFFRQCFVPLVPVVAKRCRHDQHVRPCCRQRPNLLPHLVQCGGSLIGLVQDDGDEPRHQPQPRRVQRGTELGGILRQIAGRTQLGGCQAHLAHLAEDPRRRHAIPPTGHLADAPRDRCAGDLRSPDHPISSMRTGRCSRRERSAANATTSAWRASATVHGLLPPLRTAPRNSSISTRYAASKRCMKSRYPGSCGGCTPGSSDRSGVCSSQPTATLSFRPNNSMRTSYPRGSFRVAVSTPSTPPSKLSTAHAASTSSCRANISALASPSAYTSTTGLPSTQAATSKS